MDRYSEVEVFEINDENILGLVERTKSIQIQLYKGGAVIWISEIDYLSNFQKEQLLGILQKMKNMLVDGEKIGIYAGIVNQGDINNAFENIDSLYDFLSDKDRYKKVCNGR